MNLRGSCACLCTPSPLVSGKAFWAGALFSILSSFAVSGKAEAQTFCGKRTNISTGNASAMTLGSNDCLEVSPNTTLTDWTISNGAKVSVLGTLNNSTIADSEAVISKLPQIGDGAYDPNFQVSAKGWTVNQGAVVSVMAGGAISDSTVQDGGQIHIFTSDSADKSMEAGKAQNTIVGDDGTLSVYDGGQSFGTQIELGGFENVFGSGVSVGTIVNGGRQTVSDGGIARQTRVNDGVQYVIDNGEGTGFAYDTIVAGNGYQRVMYEGQVFNTTVYDYGSIYIFEDSSITDATLHDGSVLWGASNAKMNGQLDVYDNARIEMMAGAGDGTSAGIINLHDKTTFLGVHNGLNNDDYITIDKLTGQGTIVTIPLGDSAAFSRMNIGELSGNLNFMIHTSVAENVGDFISVQKGSGNHTLMISDSGSEITRAESNSLNLIQDQSGGSRYQLVDKNGAVTRYVDGGAYMYQLYTAKDKDGLAGSVWYLGLPSTEPETPEGNGNEGETSSENGAGGGVSGETGPGQVLPVPEELKTTPSTDAMLAIASVGHNIFYNELSTLHTRNIGTGERDLDGWRLWTRGIGSHSNFAYGLADYRLNQKGIEFGVDKSVNGARGTWLIGGIVSYTDNKVKHERGGESDIDSYSASIFASYFDKSGFYFDSILKVNRFKGDIQARMTNGDMASGSYSQNAIGGALEAGYRFELPSSAFINPYLRGSFFTSENKTVKLDNGMRAKLGRGSSAKIEAGVVIGREYALKNGGSVKPYVRLAVEHEFVDSETVTINRSHRFKNDYSGTTAKIGAGMDAKISKKASIFGEVEYRAGGATSSSVSGNIGLRIRF